MAIQAVPAGAGVFGQGVHYPPEFTPAGRLQLTSGQDLVAEALTSIFQTVPGERYMEPDYGVSGLFGEPIDLDRALAQAERTIRDHEPRIDRLKFDTQAGLQAGQATLTVTYTLIGEATQNTLTFPYFVGP